MTFQYSDIVMHVHDEIVIEADPRMSVKAVCEQMSRTPKWAKGLKLDADGFTCYVLSERLIAQKRLNLSKGEVKGVFPITKKRRTDHVLYQIDTFRKQ